MYILFTLPAYRIAPKELPLLEEEIKTMLRKGLIQPSNSQLALASILVYYYLLFCIDYRKSNKVTILDKFPIPLIDDLVDRLGQSKIISVLDLAKGYYQVLVLPILCIRQLLLLHWESIVLQLCHLLAGKVYNTSAYIDDIAIF